jgi:protoheme IX farnesyltransferase
MLFGIVTGSAGLLVLGVLVGLAPAILAGTALAYYILAYTMLAKRRTRWSTLIGSAAGAIPPLVGWAAIADRITLVPLLLFAIIALWTVPHFWSLGMLRREDYAQAGLSVLPRTGAATGILVFSLLLVAAHLALMPAAGLGFIYLGTVLLLGAVLLVMSVRLQLQRARPARAARQLYLYSIVYLLALSAVTIVDRLTAFLWTGYAAF